MADITIVPLERRHSRADFCCGRPHLDNFIRQSARTQHEHYQVRVFVACAEGDDDRVMGFYSLCVGAFAPADVGAEAEGMFGRVGTAPAVYLAMLGVDQGAQGSGIGKALIRDALGRALHIAEHAGTYMVVLDAATDELIGYYEKLGFRQFSEGMRRMFIPLATVRQSVSA